MARGIQESMSHFDVVSHGFKLVYKQLLLNLCPLGEKHLKID